MTSTHRTLNGSWASCDNPEACPLLFHVELSVIEAMQLPAHLFEQLAEAVDFPTEILLDGTKLWRDDGTNYGLLHRDYDLPAEIRPDGTRVWYQAGNTHRENDQPAITMRDGTRIWAVRGLQHRDELPARIDASGYKEWWQHGKRTAHRRIRPEGVQSGRGVSIRRHDPAADRQTLLRIKFHRAYYEEY